VAKSLELIGDRWTLLIVRDLLPGTRRFQDLLASLPGIAPNILSDRLKLMEEHELVSRRLYSEHPPRAEYELTAKGKDLGLVIGALAAWGTRHVYRRKQLVHAGCGHAVKLGYFCPDCGERVRGADVRLGRAADAAMPSGAPRESRSGGLRPSRRAGDAPRATTRQPR
jgi:DNA-binding HxlR family transcriptional regulator